jgi:hypothetical protein
MILLRLRIGRGVALLAWVATVAVGAACERADTSGQESPPEARNPVVTPCGDELTEPSYSLARVYCIDGMAEDLVYIDGIAVARDSSLAMLQRQAKSIRLYDADGRFVRALGRRGKGPGEFENPARLGWHGDELWVYDTDLRRFSTFSADGDLLGTEPVPIVGRLEEDPAAFRTQPEVLRTDGVTISSIFGRQLGHAHTFLGEPETRVVAAVALDGRILRALVRLPPLDRQAERDASGSTVARPPFPHDVLWGLDPQGTRIIWVDARPDGRAQGAIAVMALSFEGDTIYDTRIPLENLPIPAAVRRRYEDRWEKRARRAANPLVADAIRRAAYVPESYPEASELVVGMDGSAWIRGELEERGYLVIAPDGSVLGRLRVPANRRVLAATTSDVWMAARDQWGVEGLERYRVTGLEQHPD